ncbi:hypothetical protein V494_05359 [Pseudogymnoascus sp. VKM F-4513 (FW-928)]|nr:hypothetical protein V494_05359 [Pseudogymnoascus sp. VKM F-4513 (FW-928)]
MLLSDCITRALLLVTVFAQKWIGPAATTAPLSVTHKASSSGAQATPWLPNQHKQILPRGSSSVSSLINSVCGYLQQEGSEAPTWACPEGLQCFYDYGLESTLCYNVTTNDFGTRPPSECMGVSQLSAINCDETCFQDIMSSGRHHICVQTDKPICNRMTYLSQGLYDWTCDSTSAWKTILPIESPDVTNISNATVTGPPVVVTSDNLKVSITGATSVVQHSDIPFKVPSSVATTIATSLGA